MKKYLILAFINVFTFSSYAHAVVINEDGAKDLKAALQDVLDYQKTTNEAFGSVEVIYEGEVTVAPQADYYNVTLPHILLKGTEATNKNVVDLGVITMNAVPDDKPSLWKMTFTLPANIGLTDDAGTNLQINIGSQNAVGLFNQNLGYFTKIDMNLMDISAKDNGQDIGLKIGKTGVHVNLADTADGRLSGPGYISLEKTSLSDDDSSFHAGSIRFDFTLDRFLPLTLKEYKEKILKHAATFESLKKLDVEDENVAIDSQAVMAMISDLYDFKMNGMNVKFSAENIGIDTYPSADELETDKTQPTEVEKFNISKVQMGFEIKGIEEPSGSLILNGGYNGFSLVPMDPEYEGILPGELNVEVAAHKVPVKPLSDLLKNTLEGAAQNPDMIGMAGMSLIIKLPAMFSQAGTELSLDHNFVTGGLYHAKLDGKVVTDMAAVSSFTAKLNGFFEGLDELIAKVKTNASNLDSYNQADYADLLSNLEMIKSYGKPVPGKGGKSAYDYILELTPQGLLLLNGKEFNPMAAQDPAGLPPPAVDGIPLDGATIEQ